MTKEKWNNRKTKGIGLWKLFLLIASAIMIVNAEDAKKEESDLKISGWGWFTLGRVVKGYSQQDEGAVREADVNFSGHMLMDVQGGIKLERRISEKTKGRFHIGITTAYQIGTERNPAKEFLSRKFVPYLIEAALEHNLWEYNNQSFFIEYGYLPVRYNPQAANLGEYLFGRSTPYPPVIESGFELADKEKIVGTHLNYTYRFGNSFFKADEYLYLESKQWPIGNLSNALILTLNYNNIVEAGLGGNYQSFFAFDIRNHTPGKDTNLLAAQPRYYIYVNRTVSGTDTIRDTTFYTLSGIKAMGRLTLNPRVLIPWDGFGSEDLKLYAEAAVLGVLNYAGWYNNIKERIPVMFGFNFPAFKLLDVLSIQLQWFGSKYYNSWEVLKKDGTPIPYIGERASGVAISPDAFKNDTSKGRWVTDDDWKWSIYMSKKIKNRVRLSLQFACDNMFKTTWMPPPPYSTTKYTEICRKTWVEEVDGNGEAKYKFGFVHDWYWMARIMYYF